VLGVDTVFDAEEDADDVDTVCMVKSYVFKSDRRIRPRSLQRIQS